MSVMILTRYGTNFWVMKRKCKQALYDKEFRIGILLEIKVGCGTEVADGLYSTTTELKMDMKAEDDHHVEEPAIKAESWPEHI